MNIEETLSAGRDILPNASERGLLLAFVLGFSREYIVAHPEHELSPTTIKKFLRLSEERALGIPFAYLTHRKEFFGLDFYVDSRVLIPRPETELLVSEVIKLAKMFKKPKILDLGTGSGCIAVALAQSLPSAKIIASDVSKGALSVALKNVTRHHFKRRIKLVHGDLLKPHRRARFAIIVANLPYIPERESALVEDSVKKFEPPRALWAGPDGLLLIGKFLQQIKKMPSPPRFVVGEIGFSMKQSVRQLMDRFFPHTKPIFKKDLNKRDRMFVIEFES